MLRKKRVRAKQFPRVGMRIIKTGLSAFICLVLNYFFSPNLALISVGASCVTMQATLQDTKNQAISQIVGTLIGGAFGCALLPLVLNSKVDWFYVTLVPVGCMLSIYLCIALGRRSSATICAFVYVAVTISPFNTANTLNPFVYAGSYIGDTLMGVTVTLLVNRFIKPPQPKPIVHLETNTYSELLEYIRERTTGREQLILLNSELVEAKNAYNPSMRWRHRYTQSQSQASIAVPQEYSNFNYISCAYVTWGYKINPLFLKQKDGYITLPADLYPVTVIWPVHTEETYGIRDKLRHPTTKGATSLPEAPHPHVLMKDPAPDSPAAEKRRASSRRG